MTFFGTPPFVGRPLDTGRVFVVAERFDHASRFLDLLSIPIGRWVWADSARAFIGYGKGATLLVCPSGYKHRNFSEVYRAAKDKEFVVIFIDEDRTR